MLTPQYLGLALFCLSLLALACLSVSRYAPNAAPIGLGPLHTTKDLLSRGTTGNRRFKTQIALTLVLGGAAIGIIVAARQRPDDASWAYGSLAALLGYWLKW